MPTITIVRNMRITGLVQGVGFRDALTEEAKRLGLAGWCRNRSDAGERPSCKSPLIAFDRRKDWFGIGNIANGISRRRSRIKDLERHNALTAARKEFPPCRIGCGVANCANDA